MTRPLSTIRNTTCIRQMSTRYPPPPRKISVVTHKSPHCLYGAPSSPTRHAVALWPHRNSIQFALCPTNMQNVMNALVCYNPILTYKRPHLIHFSSAGDYGLPTADDPVLFYWRLSVHCRPHQSSLTQRCYAAWLALGFRSRSEQWRLKK